MRQAAIMAAAAAATPATQPQAPAPVAPIARPQAPAPVAQPPAPAPVAQPQAPAPIAQEPAPVKAAAEVPAPPLPTPVVAPKPVAVTPAAPVPEPPKASANVCTGCGAALNPGQKFCLACGTPASQVPTSPAKSEAAPIPSAAIPPSYAPGLVNQYQDGPFQQPAKSNAGTLIIVIVLLALMGGGGWFAWKYFTRPDVTVTAFPQKIHVAEGGKTTFEAGVSGATDTDISWSIKEGGKGGQLTVLGIQMDGNQARSAATYTAPFVPGTYHVIATSHANPGRTATVEVIVGPTAEPVATDAATPAPPQAVTADTNSSASSPAAPPSPVVGMWRWPSGEKMTIGADSTISVTSDTDPSKNLQGTYHFSDKTHLQVDFGNGDVRTWQILGVDGNYMRVLSQSKTDASPTAIIFAKLPS